MLVLCGYSQCVSCLVLWCGVERQQQAYLLFHRDGTKTSDTGYATFACSSHFIGADNRIYNKAIGTDNSTAKTISIVYCDAKTLCTNLLGAEATGTTPLPSSEGPISFSTLSLTGSPPCPRWHRIAVGVGWAGNIILTIAVIALGVWVSQLHVSCEGQIRGTLNTSENNETRIVSSTECSCLEDFQSRLKPILCEPQNGSLAGGSGCKLCPRDWRLHGDKCYWPSKERKNWTGSRDDCSGKSAQMLVIQNQEEMASIQDVVQDANPIWIGLKVTPPGKDWTWVDGSPLDPMLFSVSGSAEGNSCGWIGDSRIQSETCGAEFKWICQKEAAAI
ncbi:killer cell lectin-like receptor subfamily F member 1 [Trachemys scripta elegans]|uniref:killer cell lectin-like receptor subfamily F member 1 n=1 Tax=Trachemys scripta elegans TaxID=31138 RepID=UPI001554982F|nr:killer cell lectin-like receptor subfamily F member 1 [Trachemys scripta elegans]